MALGVEADQNFLDQIFRVVCAKSGLGKAMLNEPSQQLRDVTEQSLIGSGIATALGAHGFGPKVLFVFCSHALFFAGKGLVLRRRRRFPGALQACDRVALLRRKSNWLSERIASMQIKHGVRS
jgi:hypothetical protein